MSFGFGVGDIANAVLLARKVYKKCRDSPGQYNQLASNVRQMTVVLVDLEDMVEDYQLKASRRQALEEHIAACKEVLWDMEGMLDEYTNMSSKARGVVDRICWDQDEARDIRQRLTAAVSMLSTFYGSLYASGFMNLQRSLNQLKKEVRNGHRDSDSVSMLVSEIGVDESSAWPQIIKELRQLGVTQKVAQKNRQFIVMTIIKAFEAGDFGDMVTNRPSMVDRSLCWTEEEFNEEDCVPNTGIIEFQSIPTTQETKESELQPQRNKKRGLARKYIKRGNVNAAKLSMKLEAKADGKLGRASKQFVDAEREISNIDETTSPHSPTDQTVTAYGNDMPTTPTGENRQGSDLKKQGWSFRSIEGIKGNKKPTISTPSDAVHLTHVRFDYATGTFMGLPDNWHRALALVKKANHRHSTVEERPAN